MKHNDSHSISMTNAVLEALRNDINNCIYESGQFVTEAEISQKFNVSKAPAREALNYLCQEGLLDKIPRKGYIVKSLSLAEVQNLFQFRNILERASVELAVRYASERELQTLSELARAKLDPAAEDIARQYHDLNNNFHISVAKLSRNPYLINALQNVLNLLRRDLFTDMRRNSLEKALEAHVLVAQAMIDRDLERALRITTDQIDVVERRLCIR